MSSFKVIVADNKGLIVFSIILLPLFTGFSYLNFTSGGVLFPMCIISIMYGSVFYIIKSFKIKIETNCLVYTSPFSRVQSIKLHNIKRVSVDVGAELKDSKKKFSMYRLIFLSEELSDDEVVINLKMFRKEDLTFLLNRVVTSSPNVEFDSLSNELLKQNYTPITDALVKEVSGKIPAIFVFIILFVMALSLFQ